MQTAVNGLVLLCSNIDRCLDGTPAKAAVAALNLIIEISQVNMPSHCYSTCALTHYLLQKVHDNKEQIREKLVVLDERAARLSELMDEAEEGDSQTSLTSLTRCATSSK
jgi:hypothetical protein